MIRFESLKDGTLDLADVALLNDYLALCADNEEIARLHYKKEPGNG